jgi:uncharacterized protein YjdB
VTGLVGLAAAACTTDLDPVTVNSIQFVIAADSQLIGRTYQLGVVLKDVNGVEVTGRTVRYESLLPEIAEADANGLVTTKRAGLAQFRATVDGRSATSQLKVLDPVTKVVVTPVSDQLPLGQTRQLVVTATSASGQSVGGRLVSWKTNNPAVATVNAQGTVSAIAEGVAVIEASVDLDGVTGTSAITVVRVPVQSVTLVPTGTQTMRVGATLQVTATPRDASGNALTGRAVNWTSSNPTVATVSSSGLVTALGTGNVSITAESELRTATLNVNVTLMPIGTVTLVPAADTLVTGDIKQYNPVVTDSLGRPVTSLIGRNVIWTSNNIPVAGVSNQGIVSAATSQTGTAAITVTIDGVTSNTMLVTVALVATIEVSPNPVAVKIGTPQQLTVTLKDAQGNVLRTSRTILYAVSAPNVLTVSPAGVVTGITSGNAMITVSVQGIAGVSTQVAATVTP